MKLGLGTVQFGMNYGISNQYGKTSLAEIKAVLQLAQESGISVIDTAHSYGDSESVLGMALANHNNFRIITKTPVYKKERIISADAKNLKKAFYDSLKKLGQPKLAGLLVHNADDLLACGGEALFCTILELKENNLVDKIGVSVYTALQIDEILENFQIDIIQLPINVFDQRLLISGHLSKLKKRGIEIHARSAFLQGLLLMPPETLPPFFDSIREHLENYYRTIHQHGLTPVRATLGFLLSITEIDSIICGVNNHHQLKELCTEGFPVESINFSSFALSDETILNPSNWRL